jgi:flagellar biosynthesis protein FlhB
MGQSDSQVRDRPPTRRRLRKAREEGQTMHSKDLSAAVALLVTFGAAALLLPTVAVDVARLLRHALRDAAHASPEGAMALATQALGLAAWVALLLLGVAALAGVVTTRLQTGAIFSFKPIKPQLERLNPVSNAKNIFSLKSLVLVGMMLTKVVVIGIGLWLISRGVVGDAVRVVHAGTGGALAVLQSATLKFASWALFAFLLLAGLDYLFQRFNFLKELRMSLQEVRREHKEAEGDPIFKQARKQAMQAPSPAEQMRFVRLAACVLSDGLGRVVPIYQAPQTGRKTEWVVVLRAGGVLGAQVLRLAREHRVPVLLDDALMARLWPASTDGARVPNPLQAAVARAAERARAAAA